MNIALREFIIWTKHMWPILPLPGIPISNDGINFLKITSRLANLFKEFPESEQQLCFRIATYNLFSLFHFFIKTNGQDLSGLEDTMNLREWSVDEIELIQSVCELIHEKHIHKEQTRKI